jgi:hypothetical protein
VTPISLTEFTAYLRDVVPLVLGGSEGHLATALASRENADALQRFARTPQTDISSLSG